jgi:hypothetical protein
MKAAVRRAASLLFAALVVAVLTEPAPAQGEPSCESVRFDGVGGVSSLWRCGSTLKSFELSLNDTTMSVGFGWHGQFGFFCKIEVDCEGRPEFGGILGDLKTWTEAGEGEQAIATLSSTTFMLPGPIPKSACGMFHVPVGDLQGRGVCYVFVKEASSAIAIAAPEDKTGIVLILVFYQHNQDWQNLRDKALQELPKFHVHGATGDAALLRWMK